MVLVKYVTAAWCGPCRAFKPIVNEVCSSYGSNVQLQPIDVDVNVDEVSSLKITSVPTVILYKNGLEIHRQSGIQSKTAFKSLLESKL
jgi:thioredoxin 1